jgi:undecaprenyl diphosphate synthase
MAEGNSPALPDRLPTHIAVIMDGNGRWAVSHGLPRIMGHRAGTENLRVTIRACVEFGIPYLTIYAFSTENWARPEDEVHGLLMILEDVIDNELAELHQEGVRIIHVGRLEGFTPRLREKVVAAVEKTKGNTRLTLCVAFNYGGRDELVYAIQHMIADGLKPEQVCEDTVNRYLFTAGVPHPDLIIRTSGEMRASNFLIWQGAYAEWYFPLVYWPDFDKEQLRQALFVYAGRDRRYGGLSQVDCPPETPDAA